MDINHLNDIEAIQFNGWNFGHIYDWMSGRCGIYPACYKTEMNILIDGEYKTACINDWIVKNDDGTFSIVTNMELQNNLC